MFVANFFIFIFLYLFKAISSQNTSNVTIDPSKLCLPYALGINYPSILNQTDCRSLSVIPFTQLGLDLKCCELEYQEENNANTKKRGCISFLSNYIDNDRYEDIIDWIERGKLDQFTTYAVFMGETLFMNFSQYPLIKNESKYEVFKLDCFADFFYHKFYLMFILALMIFIIN